MLSRMAASEDVGPSSCARALTWAGLLAVLLLMNSREAMAERMRTLNISQGWIAHVLEIHQGMVSKYLNSDCTPEPRIRRKLEFIFGNNDQGKPAVPANGWDDDFSDDEWSRLRKAKRMIAKGGPLRVSAPS